MKNKAPAFQFYVKDWLSDTAVRKISLMSRAIWIDVLCFMWVAPEQGILEGTLEELCRMLSITKEEFNLFLLEAQATNLCDISVTDNGLITICNRRMHRNEKERKNNRIRQQRYRDKHKDNGKITVPSSSASAKKESIKKEKPPEKDKYLDSVTLTREQHDSLKKKYGDLLPAILQKLNNYKMASGRKYKSDYHAILSWVGNEVEKDMPSTKVASGINICRSCREPADRLTGGLCDKCLKLTTLYEPKGF